MDPNPPADTRSRRSTSVLGSSPEPQLRFCPGSANYEEALPVVCSTFASNLASRSPNDVQDPGTANTGFDEPSAQQQIINVNLTFLASEEYPGWPDPVADSVPVASRQDEDELIFPSPYTDVQLCASDEDARRKSRAPAANLQAQSATYTTEVRKEFPFFKTEISLKDRMGGYYTLDADGLPVRHDRVLKADSEANSEADAPTRRKRKSVHQMQKPTSACDAKRWYDTWKYTPSSWGYNKFVYLEDAQLAYREYTAEDIKLYLEECPRNYTLWVQSEPSQSSHRRHDRNGKPCQEDSKCRWSGCPIQGRAVVGLYRVAFDEFPAQTSQGIKDPYKVAMLMHLWCFEQILDPLVYYNRGVLLADTRTFATPSAMPSEALETPHPENIGRAEVKNNFCSKLGDAQKPRKDWDSLNSAFYPWFEETPVAQRLPRVYEKSLCYRLTCWCVKKLPKCKTDQFDKRTKAKREKKTAEQKKEENEDEKARKRMREARERGQHTNGSDAYAYAYAGELPPESEAFKGTTFHVHLGSLAGYKKALDERDQERDKTNKRRRGTLGMENNNVQLQETGISEDVQDSGDAWRPPKRQRTETGISEDFQDGGDAWRPPKRQRTETGISEDFQDGGDAWRPPKRQRTETGISEDVQDSGDAWRPPKRQRMT
ncbi:hypothetical protein E4U21_006037 [Claviceps maximensis]|nr:hypothetical protein E4U21_006037 [Claviceps maximensis]